MHDSQLEDRLRTALRAEGDGLPLTITAPELERRLAVRQRRERGRMLTVLAAVIAFVAVAAIAAMSNGWLRLPAVGASASPSSTEASPTHTASPAASPSPDATTTPTSSSSNDPLGRLPTLAKDPASLSYYETEDPGDPGDDDPTLEARGLDGISMAAREAGVKIVCSGPDAAFRWGTDAQRASVASESIACDGTVKSFRYDVAALQPMIGQIMILETTPATAYRVLVETFGSTNDPAPNAVPSFAIPAGTVVADVALTEGAAASGEPKALRAGSVPPRGLYYVAFVCLGSGSARWSIGAEGERDFVAADEVPCDGAAMGFEPAEGTPPDDTAVWVTTDPHNTWHLIITDPYGAPSFIAPPLIMWAGEDMEGTGAAGFAECVSHAGQSDQCGAPYSPRDGAAEVTVPVGSDITFTLESGWSIAQGRVEAVSRAAARIDPFAVEVIDVATFPDGGGDRLAVSIAGLSEGEWIIRVSLNGEEGADSFGGYYDIPLNIVN